MIVFMKDFHIECNDEWLYFVFFCLPPFSHISEADQAGETLIQIRWKKKKTTIVGEKERERANPKFLVCLGRF